MLCLNFYPDKLGWLKEEDKSIGNELFLSINNHMEKLKNEFNKLNIRSGVLHYHEQNAIHHWKRALDFRNASKNEWGKLKIFKKEEIGNLKSEKLRRLCVYHSKLCYEEYREACKISDKHKIIGKQIKLRENMALCLYFEDRKLEAQLYALSAISLILRNSKNLAQIDLIEAKKVLNTVQRNEYSGKQKTEKIVDNMSNALVKVENNSVSVKSTIDQVYNFYEKQEFKQLVEQDLMEISRILIRGDQDLDKIETDTKKNSSKQQNF